ncbi:UDP-N-acetylmuramoyl-tripeptide--D-alanyl-D-alanine ligase [Corynebacterium yudongzhengii]|uniref:UDP-N-acetylmuramoyl-tripeptide--D-alanyl-D-alanine ligase n=1 Tax=Corynebacterium yudongzhengii TaxID=2080740 RepID=A0A2U1T793_9CORY|nr:UDP-N-acetylmuramoyl-tripeptide--D-alanyl-D-alanine ligase [Corynebacterium yudongzhengii]AWB81568.1 UDP-N-acetylmuramoyl-tripeptide--D-alanyl-D-alanine ligase [Corynebacterium yudongzhengii]PWC01862.1 UDP-N-acetylmuramoyl-tripeptide--D-alanyl-D-alanine ligase [Corynebacterium yudongzhengii]
MIALTLAEIAELTSGELTPAADPAAQVTGFVEFDSRRITPGGLFVALPGERVDGHSFAAAAIEKGAVAVLAARPLDEPAVIVPAASDSDADVADAVVTAMSAVAAAVAKRLVAEGELRIVGVTGSAGKTSTKDLMAAVFGTQGPTIAPPGSFNNEIGHPYTVLRCDRHTEYLVAEMSARGIGHIAHLATIAPPQVGVVLNVGSAHIGEFGSRENIARAKGELVEALLAAADGGVAVLNADDPFVAAMAQRTEAKVVTYSTATPPTSGASYYASDIELDDVARATFVLHHPHGEPVRVRLQVFGAHQVSNATATAAAAIESGLAPTQVAEALSHHRAASAHRMDVSSRADGTTIINDSYNANPESMRAAVAALAYTASAKAGARAIAVLGEMNELGDDGIDAHTCLGEELARFNVTHLVTVGGGELNRATVRAAQSGGVKTVAAADVDAAVAEVEKVLHTRPEADAHDGDVVLVKASNSAGLWRVAEALADTREGRTNA